MPQRSIRSLIARQEILTAPADSTIAVVARLMKKSGVGAVMVIGGDSRLLGIFTERDALFRVLAEHRDPKTTRLAEVMTAHPKTISPDRPFGHALLMMYDGGFRHVPVIENGKPIGIVSSRNALDPDMEEFVSEARRRKHIRQTV
jgi:CBS domain-containing protein